MMAYVWIPVHCWSLGKLIHSMVAHLDAVTSLAVDPNGLYLMSGSKYSQPTVAWCPAAANFIKTCFLKNLGSVWFEWKSEIALCPRSRLLYPSVEHGEQDVHSGVHGSQEKVWRVDQRCGIPPHQVLHWQRRSRCPRQSLCMTCNLYGLEEGTWTLRAKMRVALLALEFVMINKE